MSKVQNVLPKALIKLSNLAISMDDKSPYDKPSYEEVRKKLLNILEMFDDVEYFNS